MLHPTKSHRVPVDINTRPVVLKSGPTAPDVHSLPSPVRSPVQSPVQSPVKVESADDFERTQRLSGEGMRKRPHPHTSYDRQETDATEFGAKKPRQSSSPSLKIIGGGDMQAAGRPAAQLVAEQVPVDLI